MIIHPQTNGLAALRRYYPVIATADSLRIGTMSINVAPGYIETYWGGDLQVPHNWCPYTYTGFIQDGHLSLRCWEFSGGRYYIQPCVSAVGNGWVREESNPQTHAYNSYWKNYAQVWTLGSSHFSPNIQRLPTVYKSSGGNIDVMYGQYTNNALLPLLSNPENNYPHFHNINLAGPDITEYQVTASSPANTRWTRYDASSSIYGSSAYKFNLYYAGWFFVQVIGSASFPSNPIIAHVNHEGTDHVYRILSSVQLIYHDDTTYYYLIRPNELKPILHDYWYVTSTTDITELNFIDPPSLMVTLDNNSALKVLSWGYDYWPYEFDFNT